MNPPFTRHGAREGDRTEVHNPAFAAFGADEEEQNRLAARLTRISLGGRAHGHAGLASYFVDLADRKLTLERAAGLGSTALVYEWYFLERDSTVMAIRLLVHSDCHNRRKWNHTQGPSLLTLAWQNVLVIANKGTPVSEPRASFVILSAQPKDTLEGEFIAQAITETLFTNQLCRLEDGPFGGSKIRLGGYCCWRSLRLPTAS